MRMNRGEVVQILQGLQLRASLKDPPKAGPSDLSDGSSARQAAMQDSRTKGEPKMTTHPMGYSQAAVQENFHVTGRRVVATFVDGIVLGMLFSLMAYAFGDFAVQQGTWEAGLGGLPAFAFGLMALAYYILMEGYLGQTVGKMIAGIKVVGENTNEVPGLGPATIRTVLRIVDGLFFYLVAFITVLASSKRQRLGDMVAHTQVVHK